MTVSRLVKIKSRSWDVSACMCCDAAFWSSGGADGDGWFLGSVGFIIHNK